MITKAAKNWIINHFSSFRGQGQLGLNGTPESEEDTGLIEPVPATAKSVDVVLGEKQINYVYNLLSTEGNGNVYREFGIGLTNPTALLFRMTFAGLEKTAGLEFTFNVAVRIK